MNFLRTKRKDSMKMCATAEMLGDAGTYRYACKMTVDMMGLSEDDFVEGLEGVVTAGGSPT